MFPPCSRGGWKQQAPCRTAKEHLPAALPRRKPSAPPKSGEQQPGGAAREHGRAPLVLRGPKAPQSALTHPDALLRFSASPKRSAEQGTKTRTSTLQQELTPQLLVLTMPLPSWQIYLLSRRRSRHRPDCIQPLFCHLTSSLRHRTELAVHLSALLSPGAQRASPTPPAPAISLPALSDGCLEGEGSKYSAHPRWKDSPHKDRAFGQS